MAMTICSKCLTLSQEELETTLPCRIELGVQSIHTSISYEHGSKELHCQTHASRRRKSQWEMQKQ